MNRAMLGSYAVVISVLGSSLLYGIMPRDVLVTVNLTVRVSPYAGRAQINNVTHHVTKLQWIDDQHSEKWLKSDYQENPSQMFYFDLQINLKGEGHDSTCTFERISLNKSGDYDVRVSHQFRSLRPGKYCLTIRYPWVFKAGTEDQGNWTVTVVFS